MQGDQTEAKAVAIRILQLALLVATGLAALLFANRRWLPRIFTRDAAVIAMASLHLPILSVFLVSCCPSLVIELCLVA